MKANGELISRSVMPQAINSASLDRKNKTVVAEAASLAAPPRLGAFRAYRIFTVIERSRLRPD